MAAASTEVCQKLKDLITCSICYTEYTCKTPRGLPCLHVFCSPCIQTILDNNKKCHEQYSHLACPICKQYVIVKDGVVSNLPLYFTCSKIQDVIGDLNTEEKERNMGACAICSMSRKYPEVVCYCFNCSTTMCQSCSSAHSGTSRYDKHFTVEITADNADSVLCKIHNSFVEAFCVDCSCSVCLRCCLTIHKNHKMEEFCSDDTGREDLTLVIKPKQAELDEALVKAINMKEVFNKRMSIIKTTLHLQAHTLVRQVGYQFAVAKKEIDTLEDKTNQDYDTQIGKLLNMKACSEKLLNEWQSWQEPLQGIISAKLNQNNLTTSAKLRVSSIDIPTCRPKQVTFMPGTLAVTLGTLVKVDSTDSAQARCDIEQRSWKLLWTKDFKDIEDVDFSLEGDLIVISRGVLMSYNTCTGYRTRPPIISTCARSIYVNHKTSTITVHEDIQLKTHIYVDGSWRYDVSQTIVDHLIHADMDGSHVGTYRYADGHEDIYRIGGNVEEIWSINCAGSHAIEISCQYELVICFDEIVKIFDLDGNMIRSFELSKADTKLSIQPRAICLDSIGQLFVADASSNIFLFDQNGTYKEKILETRVAARMLALYQNKFLVVVSDGNKNCNKTLFMYERQI